MKKTLQGLEDCERLVAAQHLQSCVAVQLLTEREKIVTILVWAQCEDKQICDTLGMAKPTLRGHLKNLFGKMRVRSRVGIALTYERSLHVSHGKLFPWPLPVRK